MGGVGAALRVGLLAGMAVVEFGKNSLGSTLTWLWNLKSVWFENYVVCLPGERITGFTEAPKSPRSRNGL